MNSGAGRLAIAILAMWVALLFFFFAFHPGGVEGVSNPVEMLQWLVGEFQRLTGQDNTGVTATTTADTTTENALNYPGYTNSATSTGSSDIGNTGGGGVTLA